MTMYHQAILSILLASCMTIAAHARPQQVHEPSKASGDSNSAVEATSLLGKPLRRTPIAPERLEKLEMQLNDAIRAANADGGNPHQLIWVGRRLGYLQRYQEAIQVFTVGIQVHPKVPHLYRHRGHRYLSTRQFDLAIADFTRAAQLIEGQEDEVEADGMPNAAGIPTSTLHTNIWYHLGLAHFLKGDYEQALAAYEKCFAASKNNDMKVATLDWMYMTLRRLGHVDTANNLLKHVSDDMEILENHAYHRRLLMYKGQRKPEDLIPRADSENYDLDLATFGFGVGNWYLVNGENQKAQETFENVTRGKHWSAFGFIAAEAELARNPTRPSDTNRK